ncbi:MAG: FKBP-type peptidyl-prolyl cis-trans isomerase [Pedobacter sp.]
MSKNGLLWVGVLLAGVILSCEKPEPYDEEAQYLKDEAIIKHWADTSKVALTKDPSGLYYTIINPGTGLKSPTQTDTLSVLYSGKLLTDTVRVSSTSDEVTYNFVLANSIEAWKIGLPLIKEGGIIRLVVPSKMAYRNFDVVAGVPKNSVLDFQITLKKIASKK